MSRASTPDNVPTNNDQHGTTSTKSRRFKRKSCHFCRARKIKCSGQMICDACRERNLECFYTEGEPKGRPKSKSKSAISSPHIKGKNEQDTDLGDNLLSLTQCPSNASLQGYQINLQFQSQALPTLNAYQDADTLWIEEDSIAAQLKSTFYWLDGTSNAIAVPTNPVDKKICLINDHSARISGSFINCFTHDQSTNELSYEDIFFTIAQEIVALLTLRLGELGCSQSGQWQSHYFVKSLIRDTTPTMFDDGFEAMKRSPNSAANFTSSTGNPFSEYANHEIPQMLEIWFSQHPFSFMFSKTLLLRDVRRDAYDDVLLAAMLCDVQSPRPAGYSKHNSHYLRTYATKCLGSIHRSDVRLTTIQAMVLLGWHALCVGQARRALVLLSWANTYIADVGVSTVGINIINGVDVGAVEADSIRNTQWLLFSIFLWIIMQVQLASRDFHPWEVPASLPVADPHELSMFRLDQLSGSFSTLQYQEGRYRELWLLSYVAAFVSPIYKLCPSLLAPATNPAVGVEGWQSQVLKRLQSLSDPTEDVLNICIQVRHVLHDLVLTLDTHTQALELSVAHTVLIHLMLPSAAYNSNLSNNAPGLLGPRRIIAAGGIQKLLDDFCISVRTLLQVLGVLRQSSAHSVMSARVAMAQCTSTKIHFIHLALDACARGLHSLWSLSRSGTDTEKQHVIYRQTELHSLASELHAFTKRLNLGDFTRLGSVIEQLEIVMCYLDGVEMEDYSNTQGSTSGSASASICSRIPSIDNLQTGTHIKGHDVDFTDAAMMELMTGDLWNDPMAASTFLDMNGHAY